MLKMSLQVSVKAISSILIGFESLNPENLRDMNKAFNTMRGGFEKAFANLRRHSIRVYGTFIFGYDRDTPESFPATVNFAKEHALYIAAFNHLTPFPGTPLYTRMQQENRLLYDRWWLDERYSYNRIPFQPRSMPTIRYTRARWKEGWASYIAAPYKSPRS